MRNQRMARYVGLAKQRLESFSAWKLENIPRGSNERANALAAVAASILITETVFLPIYYQLASSITTDRVNQIDEVGPSWLNPIIIHYLSSTNNKIEAPQSPGLGNKVFLGEWAIIQAISGLAIS